MFGNAGVHIIKNPAGSYSFVGNLPAALGDMIKATTADIMAGRAFNTPNGETMTLKFPIFSSARAAQSHAASRGVAVRGVHE